MDKGGLLDDIPLIPNDVTPWFTALSAYSASPFDQLRYHLIPAAPDAQALGID
jgi:hypothetical protein